MVTVLQKPMQVRHQHVNDLIRLYEWIYTGLEWQYFYAKCFCAEYFSSEYFYAEYFCAQYFCGEYYYAEYFCAECSPRDAFALWL